MNVLLNIKQAIYFIFMNKIANIFLKSTFRFVRLKKYIIKNSNTAYFTLYSVYLPPLWSCDLNAEVVTTFRTETLLKNNKRFNDESYRQNNRLFIKKNSKIL